MSPLLCAARPGSASARSGVIIGRINVGDRSSRLRPDCARWVLAATWIQRFGNLFGQCGRMDALVEAFAALRPAILAGFGDVLTRALERGMTVQAIGQRQRMQIEVVGEQVIDPGGALQAIPLRALVANLRAAVATGFDRWQR